MCTLGGVAQAAVTASADASRFYVELRTIPAGTSMTLKTLSCSASADPVLHVMRDDGGTYTHIASDDNSAGGVNAQLTIANPPGSPSDEFILIVRARTPSTSGTCYFQRGGFLKNVSVGGERIAASTFTFNGNDELRTILAPGQSVFTALITFSTTSHLSLNQLALGNAVGGAAVLDLNGFEDYLFVGTPVISDHGTSTFAPRAGGTTLAINDTIDDIDGDGVGGPLEAALGLCATSSCLPHTPNGQDSDRDGLEDGEELWGVAGTAPGADGADDIPLARWGADPMHKDIFVEVDYRTDLGGPLAVGENPFAWMRANPTTSLHASPGGPEVWPGGPPEDYYDQVAEPFSAGPNAHLHNPDGLDGVRVHLDLCVAPIDPADEANFGDYSSASARALVPDFMVEVNNTYTGYIVGTINGVLWWFDATGLTKPEIALMIVVKALGTGEPIGYASYDEDPITHNTTIGLGTSVHAQPFTAAIAPDPGPFAVRPMPDDAMRENYDFDALQVDSARRGRFHYAIITHIGDGGATGKPRVLAGIHLPSLVHEFGHSLGITHFGRPEWDPGSDVECMPHYNSIVRYGFLDEPLRFEDADVEIAFNPARTAETGTFDPVGLDQSRFDEDPFFYDGTSTTTTDWNRDGFVTPSTDKWRVPGLTLYGSSCKAFVQGAQSIENGGPVTGAADLVRFGTRLYAFWATGSAIRYRFALVGYGNPKSCTGTADPLAGDCLTWSSSYTLVGGGGPDAFEGATAHVYGGDLWVASRTPVNNGVAVYRWSANLDGTLYLTGGTVLLSGSTDATSTAWTPELVDWNASAGGMALLYLADNGQFRFRRWTGTTWTVDAPVRDHDTSAILTGAVAPAAVGWPDSGLSTFLSTERETLAIFPDDGRRLRVYVLNPASERWKLRTMTWGRPPMTSSVGPYLGMKPFMACRAFRTDAGTHSSDFAGAFMIGWMDGKNIPRVRLSSPVSRTARPSMGLEMEVAEDYLQNQRAVSPGTTSAALYSDHEIDNVFGLQTLGGAAAVELQFLPHADGSPDHSYKVRSDFRTMEDTICESIGVIRGFDCGLIKVLD